MTYRRPSVLAVAAAMGVVLLAPEEGYAGTSSATVALEYSAVSGCSDASLFKAIVVTRLGYEAFDENAPIRVLVRITSKDLTFEGNMEWRDTDGNWAGDRRFAANSRDCEDIVRAVAFALALRLQLSAISSMPPSTSTTPVEPEPTTEAPPSPPAPTVRNTPAIEPPKSSPLVAEPPPRIQPRPVFVLGAGTLIGFNMSSSVVPFAHVFGGVAWPHWSLSVAAEASLPTTIRRLDGAGFSHQQVLASVAGCGILEPLSACFVAKAGEVRVVGKDIDDPNSPIGALLEVGLRASAMQRIFRHAYVSVFTEVLVLPILWSVTLDQNEVWTSPRFAETLGLDLVIRFE
jgi:hypothetical protein